ncbi:hypothetical protein HN588_11655 [Candidatus Bathyarchaeota archaeon]|nr:hypothetical protein [Candidatus Bathyarchaeota archaeon]
MRLTVGQLKEAFNEALNWRKPKKGEQAKFPGMYTPDPRRLVSWEVDEELGESAAEFHRQAIKAIKRETDGKISNPEAVYRRGWVWVPTWKHAGPLQYGLAAASESVLGFNAFNLDVRPPWKVSREKRKLISQAV